MDRLWSPWRLQYVLSNKTDSGCPFCEAPTLTEQQSLIVFNGQTCYVILNLYPYNNGHIMVVPYRHVATFALLTAEELQEYVAEHVSSYKRIRQVEFVDEIPKSPSGKILRRLLRDRS